jgi:Uma2 family endonuclease
MLETIETTQPQTTAPTTRGYVTFEEYLEQSSDTRICEWVDGEVITMPGASFEHQTLSDFLLKVISFYVESKDLGVVISSPFAMKLAAARARTGYFVCRQRPSTSF